MPRRLRYASPLTLEWRPNAEDAWRARSVRSSTRAAHAPTVPPEPSEDEDDEQGDGSISGSSSRSSGGGSSSPVAEEDNDYVSHAPFGGRRTRAHKRRRRAQADAAAAPRPRAGLRRSWADRVAEPLDADDVALSLIHI